MKEFKTESKKILDMMINSVYTHKDIFLRELISNASDALDKLSYMALTDRKIKIDKKDLEINLSIDEKKRTLTISDNGLGMSKAELEENLGTVARSGSLDFKEANKKKKDIDIIGQFGVGFYSAFMVADKVEVISKAYGDDKAHTWISEGIEGYEIKSAKKDDFGTDIILHMKKSDEDYDYDKYLDDFEITRIIKKYSDYITYPIKMKKLEKVLKDGSKDEFEDKMIEETLNSLIPLWKRDKKDISEEEYSVFYQDKFNDYMNPSHIIHSKAEGKVEFTSLLFIPSKTPSDLYTKEYQKGLQLYSNGVLIMEKCEELLPDYLAFVKGIVDSSDLPLNISREVLQQNTLISLIKQNVETKVLKELASLLKEDREKYEAIYNNFGTHLKFGIYNNFGVDKEKLQDLILLYSSSEKKLQSFKEYVSRAKTDQDKIYYAVGDSVDKVDMLPQVEAFKEKGIEVLYLTEYVDEFALQMLSVYDKKTFANVSSEAHSEETEDLIKFNESNKELLAQMHESIKEEVKEVKFTSKLKTHPLCLTNQGDLSTGMEKLLNAIPNDEKVKAETILEINYKHPIAKKLKKLYKDKKTKELESYSKILYAEARLIEGLAIENPTEITSLIIDIMAE